MVSVQVRTYSQCFLELCQFCSTGVYFRTHGEHLAKGTSDNCYVVLLPYAKEDQSAMPPHSRVPE